MISLRTNKPIPQASRGFVLLFSVVVAGIILLIASGVFSVSFRENILSNISREGNAAFYAADTGLECALYHNTQNAFPDPNFVPNPPSTIECNRQNISVANFGSIYAFNFMTGESSCSHVRISLNQNIPDGIGGTTLGTIIAASGFNICDRNIRPSIDSPNLTERLLEARLPNP